MRKTRLRAFAALAVVVVILTALCTANMSTAAYYTSLSEKVVNSFTAGVGPVEPTTEPIPSTEPTEPTTEPATEPTTEPTEPTTEPTEPTSQPATAQPTTGPEEPTEPESTSAVTTTQPHTGIPQPTQDATSVTKPAATPAEVTPTSPAGTARDISVVTGDEAFSALSLLSILIAFGLAVYFHYYGTAVNRKKKHKK